MVFGQSPRLSEEECLYTGANCLSRSVSQKVARGQLKPSSPEDRHGVEAEVQPVVQHDDVVVVLRQATQGTRHGQCDQAEVCPRVEWPGVRGEEHVCVCVSDNF